jgi:16S rRNA (uracil1498-N3)-methyltransferase
MALKSVYLPGAVVQNGRLEITGEEHHHLVVARAEPGEKVEVFDGSGHMWICEVASLGKRSATLSIQSATVIPGPSIDLILGLALIRNASFELALEKAVEVGVTRIIPINAARSNATGSRSDRWRRIIVEAAKQSKHFRLPTIDLPIGFNEILTVPAATKILFAGNGGPLGPALNGSPVLYLIGPEGGWTDPELTLADKAGFRRISLGSGILRSETAAIVAGALIRHEMGDF